MARKLTTKPAVNAVRTIDPFHQPCFSTYSYEYSAGGGGFISYDHNLNVTSMNRGDGNSAYGMWRTYTTGGYEFFDAWANTEYNETTSTASSHSQRASQTNQVGYLGHQRFTSSSSRTQTGSWPVGGSGASSYRANAFRDVFVLAGETHQDYAIFGHHNGTTGTRFTVHERSASMYYHAFNHDNGSECNIPIKETDYQGMYGAGCYNKKNQKLLIMESNTSGKFKPVVWNNVPDLRALSHSDGASYANVDERYTAYSESNTFMQAYFNTDSNADYSTYETGPTTTLNNYSSAGETYYRGCPVLHDNGMISYFVFMPGYGSYFTQWDASGTCQQELHRYNHSQTSYGYEQGASYGMRWQCSSDGRYVWAYAPTYYYGSGWTGVFMRVSDGKWLWFDYNDTTYGFQTCPLGKSSIFLNLTYNTDGGHGMYHIVHDLDYEFSRRDNASNWDNFFSQTLTQTIDTSYYSTAYPGLIPATYDTSLFSTPHLSTSLPDVQY